MVLEPHTNIWPLLRGEKKELNLYKTIFLVISSSFNVAIPSNRTPSCDFIYFFANTNQLSNSFIPYFITLLIALRLTICTAFILDFCLSSSIPQIHFHTSELESRPSPFQPARSSQPVFVHMRFDFPSNSSPIHYFVFTANLFHTSIIYQKSQVFKLVHSHLLHLIALSFYISHSFIVTSTHHNFTLWYINFKTFSQTN